MGKIVCYFPCALVCVRARACAVQEGQENAPSVALGVNPCVRPFHIIALAATATMRRADRDAYPHACIMAVCPIENHRLQRELHNPWPVKIRWIKSPLFSASVTPDSWTEGQLGLMMMCPSYRKWDSSLLGLFSLKFCLIAAEKVNVEEGLLWNTHFLCEQSSHDIVVVF